MESVIRQRSEGKSRANASTRCADAGGKSARRASPQAKPDSLAHEAMQKAADLSPRVSQLRGLQRRLNDAPRAKGLAAAQAVAGAAQRQEMEEEYVQGKFATVQRAANRTGMPDSLKSGLEQLSGADMSGVRVHFNSPEPARVNAHAFTQGQDIHVAPRQEKHLAHEGWHVAQQMAGRVKPTTEVGGIAINDDPGLEREADAMGARAARMGHNGQEGPLGSDARGFGRPAQRVVAIGDDERDFDTLWGQVNEEILRREQAGPNFDQSVVSGMEKVLRTWVRAPKRSQNPLAKAEDRSYASIGNLTNALINEVLSAPNRAREDVLAHKVYWNPYIAAHIDNFMKKLKAWHLEHKGDPKFDAARRDRYAPYYNYLVNYLAGRQASAAATLERAWSYGDIGQAVALMADLAIRYHQVDPVAAAYNLPDELENARKQDRGRGFNVDESSPWVVEAEQDRVPLTGGPSRTTTWLLSLARAVGATPAEEEAIAWSAFAFWNRGFYRQESGTHTFHEVMSAAAVYNVPYTKWQYPDEPPSAPLPTKFATAYSMASNLLSYADPRWYVGKVTKTI